VDVQLILPANFGRPWTYLLTEPQKEALEGRLNHVVLMSRALVFMFVVLGAFALFIVPDFVDRLEAGSLETWLLACVGAPPSVHEPVRNAEDFDGVEPS
jgi:hypothetical protein